MSGLVLGLIVGLSLVPSALALAANLSAARGAWRLSRVLGRLAPYVLGSKRGKHLAFQCEGLALREAGKIAEAAALAKARVADESVPSWTRNVAIDILISAGEYEAALGAERGSRMPTSAPDALGLALIQINLAEAEYNLGRWDAAEARLRGLELACWLFPIARAGLLQQRAWIAAHRSRAAEALELCAAVTPGWLPPTYRAEYHFTRAAALLAANRIDEGEAAVEQGERLARRLSSKRNALFLRARLAAARGDWVSAERSCRKAAEHPFRGQGGAGLLLWAQALKQLGRYPEAEEVRWLVAQRDPESEAAKAAARYERRRVGVSRPAAPDEH